MPKQGTWLYDAEWDEALCRFLEKVSEFNSISGRAYTIVVIPHETDEDIHVSIDGKPQDVCESVASIAVSTALEMREIHRKDKLDQLGSSQ